MSPDPADQRASLIGLTKAGEEVWRCFSNRATAWRLCWPIGGTKT